MGQIIARALRSTPGSEQSRSDPDTKFGTFWYRNGVLQSKVPWSRVDAGRNLSKRVGSRANDTSRRAAPKRSVQEQTKQVAEHGSDQSQSTQEHP